MPGIDFDRLRAEITMQQVLQLLGFESTRCRGDQWYGRCPLRDCPPVSPTMLLRERGNGPVLLPSLPPSRPPARTLGGGHWLTAVSSGHRPLRRVGPRSALDSALVIDTGALARDNGTTA